MVARANREWLVRNETEIFRLAAGQEPADECQYRLRRQLEVERLGSVRSAAEDVEEGLVACLERQDRRGRFEQVGTLEKVGLRDAGRPSSQQPRLRGEYQLHRTTRTYRSEIGRDPDGFD